MPITCPDRNALDTLPARDAKSTRWPASTSPSASDGVALQTTGHSTLSKLLNLAATYNFWPARLKRIYGNE